VLIATMLTGLTTRTRFTGMLFGMVLILLLAPALCYARNWQQVPSVDQLSDGDSYRRGVGDFVVVDRYGNVVDRHDGTSVDQAVRILGADWDNGSAWGLTDIWFNYNLADPVQGSGPEGYGQTGSYVSGGSDYLEAYTELFYRYYTQQNWTVCDDAFVSRTNASATPRAWVEATGWSIGAPSVWGFKGATSHFVEDVGEGWDVSFETSEEF